MNAQYFVALNAKDTIVTAHGHDRNKATSLELANKSELPSILKRQSQRDVLLKRSVHSDTKKGFAYAMTSAEMEEN